MLRGAIRAGRIDDRRAPLALADLMELPLQRAHHAPLPPRIWELRDNLTVYDAAYVSLAEASDVALLTSDGRVSRATGPLCEVELVP